MDEGGQDTGQVSTAELIITTFEEKDLEDLLSEAEISSRKRAIRLLHEPWEHAHKIINAILPDSYMRPHKHEDPHQSETFNSLKGKAHLILFDDNGEVSERVLLEGNRIVKVPINMWHMVVASEPSVLYIVKGQPEGGYNEKTDKVSALWAPEEMTEEGTRYLQDLKHKLGS